MSTIHGSGTLVSRRHQVWGHGYTILTRNGVARKDVYEQPLDESKTSRLSIADPGMGFNGGKLPAAGTFVVPDGITLPQVVLPVLPPAPHVSASSTQPPAVGPLSVDFSVTPSGGTGPYTFFWNFGDGTSSTDQNPTHIYAQPGQMSVTVTVTDDVGATTTQQLYVNAGIALSVEAQYAPINPGSAPFTVNFYAFAADGVTPLSFAWDFGDGHTDVVQNATHIYEQPGSYQAVVVVTDAEGHKTSAALAVVILAPLALDPVRIPDIGPVGLVTSFYARVSGGRPPYTIWWDFADGFGSTEANPVHQFTRVGFYNVQLAVTDADGRYATTYRAVDVGPAVLLPPVEIALLPLELQAVKPIYGWTTAPLT